MVQPYDGGAFPLLNSAQWSTTVTSAAAAAAQTVLITVGEKELGRLLGVSAVLNAGVKPIVSVQVFDQNGLATTISPSPLMGATPERVGLQIFCPIIAPGHQVLGRHSGGDAATVIKWNLYMARAPLASVFYV